MGRIVFLNPFSKNEITGGIKTAHRHAGLLTELGFDAFVFQPDGTPPWFESRAKVLAAHQTFPMTSADVLVFPEVMGGSLGELAKSRTAARKVLFCQNQYFMTLNGMPAERYAELGFRYFAASGVRAKEFMQRVFHLSEVALLPTYVDRTLFSSQAQKAGIAVIPRKLPREAAIIRNTFQLKFPQLQSTPWHVIENKSERETAEILGRSAVCLVLGSLESFGLVAIEAMAAGAIVVGFHGYGGLEYATAENGFWLPPDHLEETADALASAIVGLSTNEPRFAAMREAGFATAMRYGEDQARTALREFYGRLMA